MKHPKKGRRPRPLQKSPFLRLPREIRDQIYRAALISPTPIDLCPVNYVEADREDVILDNSRERYLKFVQSDEKRINRALTLVHPPQHHWFLFGNWPPHRVRFPPRPALLAFRLQNDLQYVRKHLATQLLQVCCQIYNEAADYFWGSNIWRFSDNDGWQVLFRFLLSIGVHARSRIHRLDVLAPFTLTNDHALSGRENWHIKNEPKLHMAKVWKSREPREHCDLVYDMWMRERSLRILNFLVPARYCLQSLDTAGLSWNQTLFMGFLPSKIRLIVESGGTAYDKQTILGQGWDLTAHPGSRLRDSQDRREHDLIPVVESIQTWRSKDDYLAGVSLLFDTEGTCPPVDGSTSQNLGCSVQVGRCLNGFGPCMIVAEYLPFSDSECRQCTWGPVYIYFRFRSLVDIEDEEKRKELTENNNYIMDAMRERDAWMGDYSGTVHW